MCPLDIYAPQLSWQSCPWLVPSSHSLLGHQVLEDCYFGSERRHKSGDYFSLLLNLEKKALISFAVGSGGGVVRGDKPNLKINWIFFLIHR